MRKEAIITIVLIVLSVPIVVFGVARTMGNRGMLVNKVGNASTPQPKVTAGRQWQTLKEETESPTEEPIDPFEGKVKFMDITVCEDVDIEEVPEELAIFGFDPIVIDEETGNAFIDNLSANGWKNHKFIVTSTKGGYMIISEGLGGGFANETDFKEAVKDFMEVSGLIDYFEENLIELSDETVGEQGQYTQFYYLVVGGIKTNSYIRINLESEGICGECKMYLCKNTLDYMAASVSFEEAMEHAFYINNFPNDISGHEYNVNEVELKYVNGLPYYSFMAYATEYRTAFRAYAPAISFDGILSDEKLLEKFMNFSD